MKRPSADYYFVNFVDANTTKKISKAYHIETCAKAAFGLVVSYLLAVGAQIPDFDMSILANASKILTIL